MARYRKTQTLKRELGELSQQERDYMENLANSLLQIQNSSFNEKPELPKNVILKENEQ